MRYSLNSFMYSHSFSIFSFSFIYLLKPDFSCPISIRITCTVAIFLRHFYAPTTYNCEWRVNVCACTSYLLWRYLFLPVGCCCSENAAFVWCMNSFRFHVLNVGRCDFSVFFCFGVVGELSAIVYKTNCKHVQQLYTRRTYLNAAQAFITEKV